MFVTFTSHETTVFLPTPAGDEGPACDRKLPPPLPLLPLGEEARPSSGARHNLAQKRLILLLHETALDAHARVGKVLADVVLDHLRPHLLMVLLHFRATTAAP